MEKTRGILLFAHNNSEIDYAKIAFVCGKYAQKQLDVPISLVTNKTTLEWMKKKNKKHVGFFDKIILTDGINSYTDQKRQFHDTQTVKINRFDNGYRSRVYDLSPYDKTLVIDTDLLLLNDNLKSIWETDADFMINQFHHDLSSDRENSEFVKVSDASIDFYWATAFYFEKTKNTKIFFSLCQHILENYDYYRFMYQIESSLVRNDFIFSIAIHILGGFSNKNKPMSLPCDIYYTTDRDELIDVKNKNCLIFLIQKKNLLGEFTLSKITDQNIHIMNKYSIDRQTKKLLKVLDND
jgi:hypothetical protein